MSRPASLLRAPDRNSAPTKGEIGASIVKAALVPGVLLLDLWRARSERQRHWILTIFFIVLGFVAITDVAGDARRMREMVEFRFPQIPFAMFAEDLWRLLTFRNTATGTRDVFMHVTGYFFGSILQLPQLFFPFVAGIYGYFFSGSILHVLRNMQISRLNYVLVGFVGIFLLIRGFDGFFTVRTWTGMWILVYACLKYYEQPKLRYLLLMFIPPLFHHGFFLICIPAWIVLVLGSRPLLYVVIFAISSVTTVIPVDEFTEQIARTERGATALRGYLVDEQRDRVERFEDFRERTNWYNAYRRAGLQRWAPTVLIYTLIAGGLYLGGMTLYQRRIFSIGLLTMAFSNMTWFHFAVHNRTLTVAMVFISAAFLMTRFDPRTQGLFLSRPPWFKWGLHLALVLYLPLALWHASVLSERFGPLALVLPFLVLVNPEINISFKDMINLLLGRR
ncbi:MAG: hypothetical protein ACXIUM_14260 [Wenzhouxiangella sp.]